PPTSTLFPYTTLFRSNRARERRLLIFQDRPALLEHHRLDAGRRWHFALKRLESRHEPRGLLLHHRRCFVVEHRSVLDRIDSGARSEEHTSELQSLAYL